MSYKNMRLHNYIHVYTNGEKTIKIINVLSSDLISDFLAHAVKGRTELMPNIQKFQKL